MEGIEAEELASSTDGGLHRDGVFVEVEGDAGGAGQFMQGAGQSPAGEIAKAVQLKARPQAALHRRPEGGAIAEDRRIEGQSVTRGEDRQAMTSQIAAHQQLIPHRDRAGFDGAGAFDHAEAAGGDEQPVRLAALHHLGVAGDDGHATGGGRPGHGGDDAAQAGQVEALLQDQGDADAGGTGAGHGQVVGGAGDGQLADVAPGKFQGMDDIAVGGEDQGAGGKPQAGGVVERLGGVAVETAQLPVDQRLRQGAAPAVAEADALRFVGGGRRRRGHSRGEVRSGHRR